ncbi:MAG TPA: glutaredoxin family protein [Thermomicrobiaceae bacterium]|nr:glutaredoxin family protein [Thermomicrobiaceae bacterium]
MGVPSVVLFTEAGSAECGRVRRILREHGVAFCEQHVSHDAGAARALAETGIFGTPLLVVGDRTVFGYRPAAILAALAEAGVPVAAGDETGRTSEHQHGPSTRATHGHTVPSR